MRGTSSPRGWGMTSDRADAGAVAETAPTPPTADRATTPASAASAPRQAGPRAKGPSLTGSAARGMAWFAAQTLINKGLTMGGQVALSYLLAREAFGQIGLAYTVTMFCGLI